MGLNKQKGNMYPFVTHTWNPTRGKCPHDCSYCYMKVYPQPELHFTEKEMETNLGEGNFIFVGSSTDAWCKQVPDKWISDTIEHCREYGVLNRFLFQSKNPQRFTDFLSQFPNDVVLGTTIETNREYSISKAPPVNARYKAMLGISSNTMVSIEPIMDFDIDVLVFWIANIKPEFVSIGADSKGHKLPEPPAIKVRYLIEELRGTTTVYIKDNLKRIMRS